MFLWGDEVKAKFLTDCGQVRDHNEDSGGIFFNDANQLLAIIADGMGGHQAGDVASELAVNTIKEYWHTSEKIKTPDKAENWILKAINKANEIIYKRALDNEDLLGMGTTVVLAICSEDFLTIGHIGDSRCYVYNENGFKQLTEDHSLVNELVRTGQISTEDAAYHPRKNVVLKALGTEEEVSADIQSLVWEQGNRLLLCSDGLTDKVSNEELFEYIQSNDDLRSVGEEMIQLANERGGEDNISLIIIDHVRKKRKEGETSC